MRHHKDTVISKQGTWHICKETFMNKVSIFLTTITFAILISCGDSGDDHWKSHFDVFHIHTHQHSFESEPHEHSHTHWIQGGHASKEALRHYLLPNPKWKYGNDHKWLGKNLHHE